MREADAFRVLTINVNYRDFPPIAVQQRDAAALARAHPDRIAFAATFDAAGSDKPGWLAEVERGLDAAFAEGAVAVKFWKDIGMQQRDPDGRAVMIDDARFDALFDWLEKRGVPVLGHQGEPRNAWLSLEEMTIRGDREYFTEHPQYHMFGHKEWPSYEEQIAARDRMLDKHPSLKFVGVHLASLEWDVDRIAEFLRRYPNASVDLAARLSHLQLQASRDHDKVRRFFIEFQDRILYGSDFGRGDGQSDVEFAADAHEGWLADWRFLAGGAELRSDEFNAPFRGLALPRAGGRQGLSRECPARPSGRVAHRFRGPDVIAAALLLLGSSAAVQGDGIRLEFDGEMKTRVVATTGQETILGPFTDSETLLTQAGEAGRFALQSERSRHRVGRARRGSANDAGGPVRLAREGDRGHGLCRPPWLAFHARAISERRDGAAAGSRLHQPPLCVRARRRPARARVLVLPERILRSRAPTGCCRSSRVTRAATTSA